jgi:hypothetical protein
MYHDREGGVVYNCSATRIAHLASAVPLSGSASQGNQCAPDARSAGVGAQRL